MKPNARLRHFLSIASSAALATTSAHAATIYWDGVSASWNSAANWSTANNLATPNPVNFPSILDDAIFNITTVNGAEIITLDANQAARSLTFNNTGTTTLTGGGTARTLTLGTGGITMAATAGAVTLGDGTAANDVLIRLTSGARTWINSHASNAFTINNSAASFTRVVGATLAFNQASTGLFSITATSLPNDSTGIIGNWATFGTGTSMRYAYNNAGVIAGYTGTAATNANDFTSASTNYDFSTTGTTTLTASRTANTIRYANAGNTIDLGASGTNTLTLNGILAAGASGTLAIQRTGGTGTVVVGASNELVIAGPQAVTISAPITGASGAVTHSGTGNLTLTGANTYGGGFTLNSGALYTGSNASVFGAGTLTINGGRIDISSGGAGTTLTTTNANTWNANWTLGRGTTGTGTWNNNGDVLLNSSITVAPSHPNITVLNLGGVISDGAGSFGLTFNTNSATLSNANTYDGGTSFLTLLNINHSGSGGTSSAIGTGTLNIAGGTINNTSGSQVTLSTNNAVSVTGNFAFTGTNSLNFGSTSVLTLSGTRTFTINGSTLTIGSVSASGAQGIVKAGVGTLVVTGANGTTGNNTINASGGVLNIRNNTSLGTGSGNTTVSGSGGALEFQNNISVTEALTLNGTGVSSGGALRNISGNNTLIGLVTLASASRINSDSGTLEINPSSGNAVTGTFDLTFGGAGNITVADPIATATGTLTKDGAGTLILSGSNTYTGGTAINGGVLELGTSAIQALGGSGSVASVGTITFGGGTLRYGAFNTTDYSSRFGSGVNQFSIDTNGLDVAFGNQIIGTANASTFTKLGAGKLTLNSGVSRYTGTTTISGGTLNANTIANANTDSSIGKPATDAASGLVIAGGILQHDAANIASTDRLFTIGGTTGDTAALDSSSASIAHTMSFTNASAVAFGNTNAHSLTLTGTNTGDNTFAPVIGDNTGATSLTKDGAGKWILTGANTYTGATAVNAGTLNIASTGSTHASSAVTVSNSGSALVVNGTVNGTLLANASTTISGAGTVNGATTINGNHNPGNSPGIQTFASGLSYGSTATLNAEFVGDTLGIRGTDFDGVNVTGGNLSINSLATLSLYATSIDYTAAAWNAVRTFAVIDHSGAGTSTGVFQLVTTNAGSFASQGSWTLGNTSNDIVLSWTPVPEPRAALLGGLGLLMLLRRRR